MSIDLTHLPKDKFLEAVGPEEYCQKYYGPVYDKMEKNETLKWNWAAALFQFSWLFYRKLYLEAIIGQIGFLFILCIICLFFPYLGYENIIIIQAIIGISMFVSFGLFGNYFYLSSLLSRMKSQQPMPNGSSLMGGFLFAIVSYITLVTISDYVIEWSGAIIQ